MFTSGDKRRVLFVLYFWIVLVSSHIKNLRKLYIQALTKKGKSKKAVRKLAVFSNFIKQGKWRWCTPHPRKVCLAFVANYFQFESQVLIQLKFSKIGCQSRGIISSLEVARIYMLLNIFLETVFKANKK